MNKVEHLISEYKPKGKEYSVATKRDYRNAFRILSGIFETGDFDKLFTERYDEVVSVLSKRYESNAYWHKVNTYCKFYDIPYKEIPLPAPNDTSKIPVHDMDMIRTKVEKIRDLKAKVFLSLLANKLDYCVRRDWATVMIYEHCNESEIGKAKALYYMQSGKFEFLELNKTGRSLEFIIEDSTRKLLDEYISELKDARYLYNYNTKEEPNDERRTNSFAHYLTRITERYLGIKMTVNDFRKGMETESLDRARNSDDPAALHKYITSVSKRDHSISTSLNFYVNETRSLKQEQNEKATVVPVKAPVEVQVEVPLEVPVEAPLHINSKIHTMIYNLTIKLAHLGHTKREIDEIIEAMLA